MAGKDTEGGNISVGAIQRQSEEKDSRNRVKMLGEIEGQVEVESCEQQVRVLKTMSRMICSVCTWTLATTVRGVKPED